MTLFHARSASAAGAVGRWFKQTLTRDNIIDGLKTLAWLAPLTLLIWIYAERQQSDTLPDQSIPITVVSSDRNRFVELRMNDKNVIAQLAGPHARLEEVRRRIQPQAGGQPVEIVIDSSRSPGQRHELDAAQELSKSPIFQSSGVTVVSCKPARLPVYVDEYVEREVEVRAPADITNLVGIPVFTPAKVTVRAPGFLLPSGAQPVVYADLQGTGLLDQPGKREARGVNLSAGNLSSPSVILSPSKVAASFEVKRLDVRAQIAYMPVHYQGGGELWNRTRVQPRDKDVINNVPVIGPQDKIDAIVNGTPPVAILRVSSNDLGTDNWISRTLEIELPPGVSVDPGYVARFEFKLVAKSTE